MNADDLNELLRKDPFEPLRIKLSNGEAYDVRDPSSAVVMKSKVFLAFAEDRFVLFPLLHVVAVENLQAA